MLHRYQNMFKVNIMRKISKADLSLRNLKKLIKEQKDKADYVEIEELNSKVRKELTNKKMD